MKTIKRKGKVQGTVLFTVVAVMMVMVCFLMSTLVLTLASKKRTYYTYFQKQAQYAAQSAIETVTNLLFNYSDDNPVVPLQGTGKTFSNIDSKYKSFYDYVMSITEANPQELILEFNPNGGEVVMGLDGSGTSAGRNQVRCKIEKVPEDAVFWNKLHQQMEVKKQWKVTATAVVGEGRNAAEYTICNYIYDNHVGNDNNPPTNSYAGDLLDSGKFQSTKTNQPANPNEEGHAVFTFTPISGSGADNMAALGPRKSGVNTFPKVSLNGTTRKYTDNPTSTQNDLISVGNSTIVGSMGHNTHDDLIFENPSEGLVVYGDYRCDNDVNITSQITPTPSNYQQLGFVYIDGMFGTPVQLKFKTTEPVNFYVGGMYKNKNGINFTQSDVYMYDPYLESVLPVENNSHLVKFTYNNISKNGKTTLGTVVCNNKKLTVTANGGDMKIDGNFYFTNPQGSLVIPDGKKLTVTGDFYCAGTYDASKVTVSGTTHTTSPFAGNYPANYATQLNTLLGNDNGPKYNYSGIPFDSRKDEIFTKFIRWDLPCDTASEALDYIYTAAETAALPGQTVLGVKVNNAKDIDPEIAESRAAGHSWTYAECVSDGAKDANGVATKVTKYFPCTTPTKSGNAFIPGLQTVTTPDYLGQYPTSLEEFKKKYKVADAEMPWTGAKSVGVYSHDQDGNAKVTTVNAFVVTESCTIDLSKSDNSDNTIFVDASNKTSKDPIVLVIKGRKQNGLMTIISNNTAFYDKTKGYAATTENDLTPYWSKAFSGSKCYADKDEVVIYMDTEEKTTCDLGNKLLVVSSGAYYQLTNQKMNVVSNPYYPPMSVATANDAKSDPWLALGTYTFTDAKKSVDKISPDMTKFELVSNITMYGKAGVTYKCINNMNIAADIKMPASYINAKAGNYQNVIVKYRENTDNIAYTTPGYNIFGVGTMMSQTSNNENRGMYVYLGDLNRPTENVLITPNFGRLDAKSQELTDPSQGNFGVDHQGAN